MRLILGGFARLKNVAVVSDHAHGCKINIALKTFYALTIIPVFW